MALYCDKESWDEKSVGSSEKVALYPNERMVVIAWGIDSCRKPYCEETLQALAADR